MGVDGPRRALTRTKGLVMTTFRAVSSHSGPFLLLGGCVPGMDGGGLETDVCLFVTSHFKVGRRRKSE